LKRWWRPVVMDIFFDFQTLAVIDESAQYPMSLQGVPQT